MKLASPSLNVLYTRHSCFNLYRQLTKASQQLRQSLRVSVHYLRYTSWKHVGVGVSQSVLQKIQRFRIIRGCILQRIVFLVVCIVYLQILVHTHTHTTHAHTYMQVHVPLYTCSIYNQFLLYYKNPRVTIAGTNVNVTTFKNFFFQYTHNLDIMAEINT